MPIKPARLRGEFGQQRDGGFGLEQRLSAPLDIGRAPCSAAQSPHAFRLLDRWQPEFRTLRPAQAGLFPFKEDKMTIPDHAKANFHTLLRAAADGNLALMECLDIRTSEPRYVLCAVGHDGTDHVFTRFGHLADGNPYDAYAPPDPDNPQGFLTADQARSDNYLPTVDDKGESDADQT